MNSNLKLYVISYVLLQYIIVGTSDHFKRRDAYTMRSYSWM